MFVATKKQMMKYDERLLEEGYSINSLVDKASDCLLRHCQGYQKLVIVCGRGNNGADGLSLAIKLFDLQKDVKIFLVGQAKDASSANLYYASLARKKNIPILETFEGIGLISLSSNPDAIIDAIFGFGLHSNPHNEVARMIKSINMTKGVDIIACDIPTGLQCDSGYPYENTVKASKTITLTAYKEGFLNPISNMYTGEVIVESLATENFCLSEGLAQVPSIIQMNKLIKQRVYDGYKGSYGKVLHITGSDMYRGATLLSAKAAVYSGSGMVSVCSTKEVLHSLTGFVPEATMFLRTEVMDYSISNHYDAILVGCGLGLNIHSYAYVQALIKNSHVPLVIDGDALTIVAEHKELLKNYKYPIILTPHIGEFKRFLAYLEMDDIVDVARLFAKEYNVILVVKGPHTLLTDGEVVYRNPSGNATMATAGMGDVLAGMISSFVGQGYSPLTAARLGVYLHGVCGDTLAKENYTALPSELIKLIPKEMDTMIKS
jgi:NAD(P)H-hydrate epimerase